MKALVTGAAGFIGSHLCDALLEAGADVVGLDAFTPFYDTRLKAENIRQAKSHPRFRLIDADLQHRGWQESVGDVTHVFHLAGQPGVRGSWDQVESHISGNIGATQALLAWCVGRGLDRIVLASTSAVYGSAPAPFCESEAPVPVSAYGWSKLAAETLARQYATQFDLPIVTLRYFSVFGPRQRPDMAFARLIDASLSGEVFPVYGSGRRDYSYVSDVVDATMRAATLPVVGRTINVAGGRSVSLPFAIQTVSSALGVTPRLEHLALNVGEMVETEADLRIARGELGYRPHVSFEDGIARQVAWSLLARKVAA